MTDEDINLIAALAIKHGFDGAYNRSQESAAYAFANRLGVDHQYFHVNPDHYPAIRKVSALVAYLDASRAIPGYEGSDEHQNAYKLLLMACKQLDGYGAPSPKTWEPVLLPGQRQRGIA